MKRLLALLLAMVLFCCAAMAEGAEGGLVFEISGITVCDEWAGETSDTHKWIAVNGTLTNWEMEELLLYREVSGSLFFKGKYVFEAEVEFGMDTIEPLVQVEGALVFKVPNMVAEADASMLEISLILQGEEQPLSTEGIGGTTASPSGKMEGPGFESPAAAVEAYVEAFNRGDVQAMLSTFAIESYIDHLDPQAYIERLGAVSFGNLYAVPMGNEYHRNLMVAMRYGDLLRTLLDQYITYNVPEEYADLANGMVLNFAGDNREKIPAFVSAMSDVPMTDWFGTIEVKSFLKPEELFEDYFAENLQRTFEKNRISYGCDELVDVPVLISIDGEEFLLCIQCARYGDQWYNISLGGMLTLALNLNTFTGGLIPFAELM